MVRRSSRLRANKGEDGTSERLLELGTDPRPGNVKGSKRKRKGKGDEAGKQSHRRVKNSKGSSKADGKEAVKQSPGQVKTPKRNSKSDDKEAVKHSGNPSPVQIKTPKRKSKAKVETKTTGNDNGAVKPSKRRKISKMEAQEQAMKEQATSEQPDEAAAEKELTLLQPATLSALLKKGDVGKNGFLSQPRPKDPKHLRGYIKVTHVEKRALPEDPIEDDAEEEEEQKHGKRITLTRARSEYNLPREVLDDLPCKLTRNPHYRSAAPMRLYLLRDVLRAEHKLSIERQNSKNAFVAQNKNEAIDRLVKQHVFKDEIAPCFHGLVFGDFLSGEKKNQRKISVVKRYAKAAINAQTLLSESFWKRSMLFACTKVSPPEMKKLLRTADSFKTGTYRLVLGSMRKSYLLQRVLECCLSDLIKPCLDDTSLDNLTTAYPDERFVKMLTESLQPEFVEAEIKRQVAEKLGQGGDWLDNISNHSARAECQAAIRTATFNPQSITKGSARVVESIVYMLSSTREQRLEKLRAALDMYSVPLPEFCTECTSYLQGHCYTGLDHVVAVSRIYSYLHEYGSEVLYSENYGKFKQRLESLVVTKNLSYEQACDIVLRRSPTSRWNRDYYHLE
mmetsp:Transcript_8790/g.16405  ORF Transcript_8790/g.16405 Transcript_8790/m.16405 type:complete len:619 (-) Transcript_8790:447-2303(-)